MINRKLEEAEEVKRLYQASGLNYQAALRKVVDMFKYTEDVENGQVFDKKSGKIICDLI